MVVKDQSGGILSFKQNRGEMEIFCGRGQWVMVKTGPLLVYTYKVRPLRPSQVSEQEGRKDEGPEGKGVPWDAGPIPCACWVTLVNQKPWDPSKGPGRGGWGAGSLGG